MFPPPYSPRGDNIAQGLELHRQALGLARENRYRRDEASALYGLALARRGENRLDQALARVEDALEIVESLRLASADPDQRSSYLASKYEYYELYVDLLMERHQSEPLAGYDARALHASERSRARSFLEALIESDAEIRQGVDVELLRHERALRRELNVAEIRWRKMRRQAPANEVADADRLIDSLLGELQRHQEEIRLASPRYADLTQPRLLRLPEIQQRILDDETVLLSYALGEARSFLFVVTVDALYSYKLPSRREIEERARKAYRLLSRVPAPGTDLAARRAAIALSEIILAPAAARLGARRLLVVSDGALQYLPFAALPDPGDHEPLVVRHEIVHLPSVSSLAALEQRLDGRPPAPKTLAVVADPVYGCEDSRVRKTCPRPDYVRYLRLPYARPWTEEVSSLVSPDERRILLGFDATLEAVRGGQLAPYRFVHFYTHGELDARHPALSRIVLSLADESGRSTEGFLNAYEAYNLDLQAGLVVLGACKTALGREVRGEGLVGLTRGFMYAGAARVVVSLWSVRDRATAELMKRFYRKMLEEGMEPAAALRAAQLSMRQEKRWAAPFYWAPFMIQGVWRKNPHPD